MVDKEMIFVAGSVASAVAVALTLLGSLYGIFREDLAPIGAVALAAMGVILFVVLVLSIANQIKIQGLESDEG